MALDGIFLNCIMNEIKSSCIGARVDKVYQPTREELVLSMRSRTGSFKLLLSSNANSARINITETNRENPQTPPMFCMLMRKYLCGAILENIRQNELDRVLFLDFNAVNGIGDRIKITLCIEIMAQYSNIILIDDNGNIIDSIKRVDFTKSSVREILPGIKYQLPLAQDKLNLLEADINKITETILKNENKKLSLAILNTLQGVSPVVCREIAYKSCGEDEPVSQIIDVQKLSDEIEKLKARILNGNTVPFLIKDDSGKPIDFSFMPITQYEGFGKAEEYKSFSSLVDAFYEERDKFQRIKSKTQDLDKFLNNTKERISKKINIQKEELEKCADREKLRIYAELINANQYSLPKGVLYYDIENYYDENKTIRIPADPALPPQKNSQKYYKEYKKANTAEHMLKDLIEKGEQELQYIESVICLLYISESENEINAIREELTEGGYLKKSSNKSKKQKPLEPLKFVSDDGFTILVGRNNTQNDYLSLKFAKNYDMWLHTQDVHGSHVIIVSDNREITEKAIEQAAVIAAYYSKAREASKVLVDYTYAKNLKKPSGAPFGKVIYHVYNTIAVFPDREFVERHVK